MMAQAQLSIPFQRETLKTSPYIMNGVQMKIVNSTPYQFLKGSSLDLGGALLNPMIA